MIRNPRLRNAAADSESFYLMHCGTHQLNLVCGKAIAAIRHEGSDWLVNLHSVVKWLRKQANFIESLGSQWPYHIEVRWTSLEAVLAWWWKNQEVTAQYLMEEKEISDEFEWWLVLIIGHEHFKVIGGAMRSLQGRALLVEGKLEKVEKLRGQIAEMHCITSRSGLDADSRVSSECDESSLSDNMEGETITYQGSALATVAARCPWQARLQDIWDGVSKHGLDAWDLQEKIVDVGDEGPWWIAAAAPVATNVAVLGFATVQGLTHVLKRERRKGCPIPLPCRTLPLAPLDVGGVPVTDSEAEDTIDKKQVNRTCFRGRRQASGGQARVVALAGCEGLFEALRQRRHFSRAGVHFCRGTQLFARSLRV
jgi:hypothetical protein